MDNVKPWYQSMAVWGAVTVIGAVALQAVGYVLPTGDTNALIEKTINWVSTGAELVGAWAALYGRVTATRRIG